MACNKFLCVYIYSCWMRLIAISLTFSGAKVQMRTPGGEGNVLFCLAVCCLPWESKQHGIEFVYILKKKSSKQTRGASVSKRPVMGRPDRSYNGFQNHCWWLVWGWPARADDTRVLLDLKEMDPTPPWFFAIFWNKNCPNHDTKGKLVVNCQLKNPYLGPVNHADDGWPKKKLIYLGGFSLPSQTGLKRTARPLVLLRQKNLAAPNLGRKKGVGCPAPNWGVRMESWGNPHPGESGKPPRNLRGFLWFQ